MADSPIVVITTPTGFPIVVDATDPALVGQVVLDYLEGQPSPVAFNVVVQPGTRRTPDEA